MTSTDHSAPTGPRDVTFGSARVTLLGPELRPGDPAPAFSVVSPDMTPVRLSDTAGGVRLLCSLPSLDTPVCDQQMRRMVTETRDLVPACTVLAISADLPFALRRWCLGEGTDAVVAASDHRELAFGRAYGVAVEGLRLLARGVFVVDATDTIVYAEYVADVANPPDHAAALHAVRSASGPAPVASG